jgi:hypothetical protein
VIVEKPPKTVMIPLYVTHADTGTMRDLCAYLQRALHIDIDPDVGPNMPGVLELRMDARRLEHAAQYPNMTDPMLDLHIFVDVCQPDFEAADYFWPTKPGRYTLWHATAPCAVYVLSAAGGWSPGFSSVTHPQATLQGAGWIGARVGAKPAEIVMRTPPAGASVGKTELFPWPATYVLHPGQAVEIAIKPLPAPTQPAEPQQAAAPPPGTDVAAAKKLIDDAKAAYAAATKGSKHDQWAFDFGPRLWALATRLLGEQQSQSASQGEKHDDTRTAKSGGSEPGHAGPAAAGG